MKGDYITYRAAFQSLYPNEYTIATQDIIQSSRLRKSLYLENYKNLIDNLLISMQQNIKTIIRQQLSNLIPPIISISDNAVLNIPQDQYQTYNILISCWGSVYEKKKFRIENSWKYL